MSHRADRRSAYPSGFRNHLLRSRGDGAAHYTTAPVKRWSAMLMSAVSMVLVSCALEHSSDAAPATAEEKILLTPDALSWRPIPREWVEGARPPGFKGGSEVAILQGDPSQQGRPYVIRFRSPPGSQLPPIWASDDESLTVLSGTLCLGVGTKFDETACQDLPAGSFVFLPKGVPHFAINKGDVVQVHGTGPLKLHWVEATGSRG